MAEAAEDLYGKQATEASQGFSEMQPTVRETAVQAQEAAVEEANIKSVTETRDALHLATADGTDLPPEVGYRYPGGDRMPENLSLSPERAAEELARYQGRA
jgi:hypothetical protein